MNTDSKTFSKAHRNETGNAMIYVLVVVALFAALSFILSRQSATEEAGTLSAEKAEIYASSIQQSAMQLKQSIEQMLWTGTDIDDLNFMTSDNASFETGSPVAKVFHPQGGGMILPRIPDDAINEINATTPARWYIGRFNDVGWTPTTADDVILTAYQISEIVCQRLNEKLTNSTAIPVMSEPAYDVILYSSAQSSTIRFTSAECAGCYGKPSLCVEDTDGAWSFYSIMAAQ